MPVHPDRRRRGPGDGLRIRAAEAPRAAPVRVVRRRRRSDLASAGEFVRAPHGLLQRVHGTHPRIELPRVRPAGWKRPSARAPGPDRGRAATRRTGGRPVRRGPPTCPATPCGRRIPPAPPGSAPPPAGPRSSPAGRPSPGSRRPVGRRRRDAAAVPMRGVAGADPPVRREAAAFVARAYRASRSPPGAPRVDGWPAGGAPAPGPARNSTPDSRRRSRRTSPSGRRRRRRDSGRAPGGRSGNPPGSPPGPAARVRASGVRGCGFVRGGRLGRTERHRSSALPPALPVSAMSCGGCPSALPKAGPSGKGAHGGLLCPAGV